MTISDGPYDAVVIGGGFFGCEIASYLKKNRGFEAVLIIEQESGLFARASLHNQARVHGGYHYPRDFKTAHRSRVSRDLFLSSYPSSVVTGITSLYAIARKRSQVGSEAFSRRMSQAGAVLKPAPMGLRKLFNPHFIEEVYEVEEEVFDAESLKSDVTARLTSLGVEVLLQTKVEDLGLGFAGLKVRALNRDGRPAVFDSRYVFNCTYSGLNSIASGTRVVHSFLKHEVAELALIEAPSELDGVAVTVMDGPFFSALPYPPARAHSLSHVRYTPQVSWIDDVSTDPYRKIREVEADSRRFRMVRDAAKYVPVIGQSKVVGSFREVKTVLADNEENDGRPILVERSKELPGLYSILGGKIDNIFDVFLYLESLPLAPWDSL